MIIELVHSTPIADSNRSEFRPLIPPGIYTVAFGSYETAYHFGKSPKLIMHFHVVDYGSYFGTKLNRWYSVAKIGKPSRNGSFKARSQTSTQLIEYVRCLPHIRTPTRLDRISMSSWADQAYKARVVNVTTNSQQVSLPIQLQYSKIAELLGVAG